STDQSLYEDSNFTMMRIGEGVTLSQIFGINNSCRDYFYSYDFCIEMENRSATANAEFALYIVKLGSTKWAMEGFADLLLNLFVRIVVITVPIIFVIFVITVLIIKRKRRKDEISY
ncbi:MAG: hypothetical protein ACFFDI_21155, partial [Promethearchaeota archaeon]